MGIAKQVQPTDNELEAITRLQQGDIGGLEVLVLRYQLEAVRTAYLICHDRALAEDIAQATFLRVYERIEQFDTSKPFAPWLLKSVANNALQAVRRQARTTSIDSAQLEQEDSLAYEQVAQYLPSLEEKLERLNTNEALSAAMAQLPPEQRTALVMRYYFDLSMEEISDKLDCSAGTARWRLFRGRERLRHILEPFWRATRQSGGRGTETSTQAVTIDPDQMRKYPGKTKAGLGADVPGIPSYPEKGDL